MTEKWEGFSQEEIINITNPKPPINKDTLETNSSIRKIIFKQNKYVKKNLARERLLSTSNAKHYVGTGEDQPALYLPKEARLCNQQIPEEKRLEDGPDNSEKILFSSSESNNSERILNPNEKCDKKTDSETVLSLGEISLDDFEKRQKMIKEQNRQRKELLKKALEDRTKRTHEEARRLGQIEEELKKLDIQLSNDVSILRNQIEVASLDFMEAQKRFDKAEREYLDAKLALFTKKERKELLTSHLCTIIEQNELRKAKKLSDLMDKLQLGSVIIEKPMEILENSSESTKQDIDKPVTNVDQDCEGLSKE